MSTRREARERALSLCYELDVRGVAADGMLADLPAPPSPYVVTLVRGVDEHRDEVDEMLRKYSEHWALERMPLVDRAILRIGCYELGWERELPTGVVISEAVELAKQYSTKDSGRFVNGMLGRIAEDLRAPESTP
jgi:N utilization substance protein B